MGNYFKDSLYIPKRTKKPREYGITVISDQGLGIRAIKDLVETAGEHIDFVKFSIGTAYVTLNVQEKIELYKKNNIEVFFGGTLFEIYAVQNRVDQYKILLKKLGLNYVEISNGLAQISDEDKLKYVNEFKEDFNVISEVGCKDEEIITPPYKWVQMIKDTLDAGAAYVIAEGRESGNAGLYRQSKEVRMGLIEEIIYHISPKKIIFEAPLLEQQVFFINKIGPNVNLGNIIAKDIILLEAQRCGLKYETFMLTKL